MCEEIKEEKRKKIYSNFVNVGAGTYDFSLIFGERIEDGNIEEKVEIIMSPQHMKSVYELIEKTINGYEDTFGKINIIPNKIVQK